MSKLLTTRHKQTNCPRCSHQLNATTDVQREGQRAPEPGDVTVCINCGQILTFEEGLQLRRATAEEVQIVQADQKLWRLSQFLSRRFN